MLIQGHHHTRKFFLLDISFSRPGLEYHIQMLPVSVSQLFFTSKETLPCPHTHLRVLSPSSDKQNVLVQHNLSW